MKSTIKEIFTKADKIRIGYGLAFLLLLISLGLTTYSIRIFIAESKMVNHTHEVITSLATIANNIKDAERGFQGYMLMNDEKYLKPYNGSKHRTDSVYSVLQQQTYDNYAQQKKLHKLKRLIDTRFEEIAQCLQYSRADTLPAINALLLKMEDGRLIMDSIKTIINAMQVHEKDLAAVRKVEMNKTSNAIQFINIASLLGSILLAFYSIITYTKENDARTQADTIANDYRVKLEQQLKALKQANEELIALRRNEKFASTGRIARTIAHEVRNPLTNINLSVEQLKEDIGNDKEDINTLLNIINRNSSRINQLVSDLLNSTKFLELHFEKKSINDLLDEALEMAGDRIDLHRIAVIKKYQAVHCNIVVDPDKIKIALLNIIVNAIEAMETGKGILTLETAAENNACIIKITDNGYGMNEEALQRLFEPYFTKKVKGTGLGMTHTQNIILNHKGNIQVESDPGKGTTFTITLQLLE